MRSWMSQGVPEWSGGEDLYMGSPGSVAEMVSGVIGIVPGPPKGIRGPPVGATYLAGLYGLNKGGNQPPSGLVPSHIQPIKSFGAGGPTRWTPGHLSVVPVQYR